MLDFFKKVFLNSVAGNESGTTNNQEEKLRVATCVLFVQMAQADDDFSDSERSNIISIMKNTFSLNDDEVLELLDLSEQKVKESISIYEFASIINEHFSSDDKFELIKNLWRLIYVDDTLDKYEDKLIKMIAGLLNVEHKYIIGAKLLVQKERA